MKQSGIILKSEDEILLMRDSGRIVCAILDELENMITEGVSTLEIDSQARILCKKYNVIPAFLGYYGFPSALCISVNEEVVHGIPSERILKNGDIVSLDMGVVFKGYFSDTARTCIVGKVDTNVENLIHQTKYALDVGIAHMVDGGSLFELSLAIQKVAEQSGLGIIRDYSGHGIGKSLHEAPAIFNYCFPGYKDLRLSIGMVFAIEPMFSLGAADTMVLSDNWTVITKDRSYAAHFEHTVAITKEGFQILTN